MEKAVCYENLRNFAYSNDKICQGNIKGIVLEFFGLGGAEMYMEDTDNGRRFAQRGILYIIPYYNPWAWMNNQAVSLTDEIVDVLIQHYKLSARIPIVSTGGSMGGLSSLVYTAKAKRTPVACVSNCPVCDLPFHYTERPDLPRTLYSAFYGEDGPMEKALKTASPLHLAEQMPDVKYYIFHCDEDKAVNKEQHSDRFVARLKQNHDVCYHTVKGRGHCDLTDEMRQLYNQYIINSIDNEENHGFRQL